MEIIKEKRFEGERALFASRGLDIRDSVFENGESPLKESRGIRLDGCIFKWKYPLWYCDGVSARGTTFLDTARSGIWYTKNITMNDCVIDAPKTFRRSENILLKSVRMPNASETMWSCKDIHLRDVSVRGDYFGMGSVGVEADGLHISGNYAFDGGMNIIIRNSRLISKDAFWNCENVEVYDSLIVGEYLGWNSKNIKFVNCTIESNQGLCYMDGVKLVNCKLVNTDLAFEYSTVDADIVSSVVSIKNPSAGKISAYSIGEVIMEPERVDTEKTEIVISGERTDD
ncbi:MAG: DUF3737 family protein [Clostridia bacterium]|nr:DUF3737 family protein [Clostridia bacterium]